jgi:hypothetical protein
MSETVVLSQRAEIKDKAHTNKEDNLSTHADVAEPSDSLALDLEGTACAILHLWVHGMFLFSQVVS